MSELNKYAEEVKKIVTNQVNKAAKLLAENNRDITEVLRKERKKLEIRSQIGQHQRQVAKAYERIGQAYYEHEEQGKSMDYIKDVMDLLRSNLKVIDLLNEQLKQLEPEDTSAK